MFNNIYINIRGTVGPIISHGITFVNDKIFQIWKAFNYENNEFSNTRFYQNVLFFFGMFLATVIYFDLFPLKLEIVDRAKDFINYIISLVVGSKAVDNIRKSVFDTPRGETSPKNPRE